MLSKRWPHALLALRSGRGTQYMLSAPHGAAQGDGVRRAGSGHSSGARRSSMPTLSLARASTLEHVSEGVPQGGVTAGLVLGRMLTVAEAQDQEGEGDDGTEGLLEGRRSPHGPRSTWLHIELSHAEATTIELCLDGVDSVVRLQQCVAEAFEAAGFDPHELERLVMGYAREPSAKEEAHHLVTARTCLADLLSASSLRLAEESRFKTKRRGARKGPAEEHVRAACR